MPIRLDERPGLVQHSREMDKDETASYTLRPVTVEGKLRLDVMKGEKYDLSIYLMDGAKVTK